MANLIINPQKNTKTKQITPPPPPFLYFLSLLASTFSKKVETKLGIKKIESTPPQVPVTCSPQEYKYEFHSFSSFTTSSQHNGC